MKKLFILILILPLIWNCTPDNNEITVNEAENDATLHRSPIASILESDSFASFISSYQTNEENFKNENSNGVFFIESAAEFILGVEVFPYLVIIYDESLLAGGAESLIDVKIFSEDRAQFFSNARNPVVEIYDLSQFTGTFWDILVYSNLCSENRRGNLHINLIAPYIETTSFGFDILSPVFSEVETANNLQLSSWVNNNGFFASQSDYFNFEFQCVPSGDGSVENKIHLTSLFQQNGGDNISLKGL